MRLIIMAGSSLLVKGSRKKGKAATPAMFCPGVVDIIALSIYGQVYGVDSLILD